MNRIDELSFTKTTPQTIQHYRNKYGEDYLKPLTDDLWSCGEGNRRAILAVIGQEVECYMKDQPERERLEDADIVKELRCG